MHPWLEIRWTALLAPFTADKTLQEKYGREIERKYAASARHYHTLQHIHDMLALSEQYKAHAQQPDIIDFSILYHDIIYNAWRKDNEERSAALAVQRLSELGVPADKTGLVKLFIEATQTHTIPPGTGAQHDLCLFLDLDMAILAAEWNTYVAYTAQVRKEYHIYPEMLYKAGRRKFLQNTLQSPTIFHTDLCRGQFESRARRNMEKELQSM